MGGLKFNEDLNLRLVRGIQEGYSKYAELRREKSEELHVSGAYAWVRGNHIEDQVARELQEVNINSELGKAGYTWEYLQFNDSENKSLIIIKGVNILKNKPHDTKLDIDHADHYLVRLAEINSGLDFGNVSESEQGILEFPDLDPVVDILQDDNIKALKKTYEKFYILTYNIDRSSRMISEIDLWMPEYQGKSNVAMVRVDSLTDYLDRTEADVDLEAIGHLVKLPEEELSGTFSKFGIKSIDRTKQEER